MPLEPSDLHSSAWDSRLATYECLSVLDCASNARHPVQHPPQL